MQKVMTADVASLQWFAVLCEMTSCTEVYPVLVHTTQSSVMMYKALRRSLKTVVLTTPQYTRIR